MKSWFAGTALIGALGASPSAAAYTLDWLGSKLPNGATYPDGGGDPFLYYVDETQSMPGGLPVASIEAEVRAAFQTWSAASCSYIGARFDGGITNRADVGNHTDTQSLIASFINSSSDPRYPDDLADGLAVGVALLYSVDGVIEGCDVEYNAVDWTYADDGGATAIDFPSVAQHETGHCFGLADAPEDPGSVMYPSIAEGVELRTPDARDIDNLCQLYPATGSIGSPCSGSSCGAHLSCITNSTQGGELCSHACDINLTIPGADGGCEVGFGCQSSTAIAGASGACFPGPGDQAQVGGQCRLDTDCVGAAAVCLLSAGSLAFPNGYCSEACVSNACPDGNTCVEIGVDASGNPQDYCLNSCSAVTGGCRDDGYACNPLTADGTGFCYPACQTDADCGVAACLCSGTCAGIGSPTAFIGSACSENGDCPTGAFCIPAALAGGTASGWSDGYCAESCGGTNACVTCPTGSDCVLNGQEGQAYCLQACSANGGCRTGYSCASELGPSGEVGVCEPGLGSACLGDSDCPAGEVCAGGTCQEPGGDGGCSGALCESPDGGVVVQGHGGDAGPTNSAPAAAQGGCGCGEPGADLLALGIVGMAGLRRRSPW